MIYGIYQSAAGLQVNEYRQEVLANNLANLATVGFKHDLSVVRERQVASAEELADPAWSDRELDRMTGGSLVAPTYTSFEQGRIDRTGNPMDVAIVGDGFFAVKDGDLERYTRDGRLTLNGQGELVTVAGERPVLDESGRPIVVPAGSEERVSIEPGGVVRVGDAEVGRLQVVDFENKAGLRKIGDNLFAAIDVKPTPATARLEVGSVEGSTVDATEAMVSLIQVSRAYEMNARLLGLADATLGRAVNDIARIQ